MSVSFWPTPDGNWRSLANRPSTRVLATRGALPDVPASQFQPFDLRTNPDFRVKIKDQGQRGACNGHAAASSDEIARFISGQAHVDLSAWKVYADLCQGVDRGSCISDALEYMVNHGTCREELVVWGTINPSQITQWARDDAARFRIEIGHRLNTFAEMCVAAQLRQPFNFSIPVNGNFNTLDQYGRPGNHAGAHNHAVCGGLGMKKLPTNEWAILAQNSWGTGWGDKGYFWFTEKNLGGWGWDAYSVVATVTDPQNQPPAVR